MKEVLTIVKIGGNIVSDPSQLSILLENFSKLSAPKILVHGGGKIATEVAEKLGVAAKMIDGRRITDEAFLDIALMCYAGLANKKIVAELQSYGCHAIGLSGADGNSIQAHQRPVHEIDYGLAGDIDNINTEMILSLIHTGLTPVFCALTHDKKGQMLNTNADTIASSLATHFAHHFQVELVYCFEKKGVLLDIQDDHSVISHIDTTTYHRLLENKQIAAGMIPKMKNAFDALKAEVEKVIIGDIESFLPSSNIKTTITL